MDTNYQKVIEANIALHSKMSDDYSTCEPHFRTENIANVEGKLKPVFEQTRAKKLLDLGCGTGFVINIAKKYVSEIHGVDVTQAMMDKVDKTGNAKIELYNHDTGSFPAVEGAYDVVTAYSFLHHLYDVSPTIKTAYKALRTGGVFYADLDPNYYFWEEVNRLDRKGNYDEIVKREIEMVTYKDEDIEKNFGVDKDVFNAAEYGKNIKGGFRAEELGEALKNIGFKKVNFFYHWFIGQGKLINDEAFTKEERFRYADITNIYLQKALPLSKTCLNTSASPQKNNYMQIAFIGYGELGRQIHAFIQQSYSLAETIFFDDGLYEQKQINSFPFASYEQELYKNYLFIIGLGYKQLIAKQSVIQRLDELGRIIYSFIHPSCFVNPSAIIENGVVAYPMCNIDKEVRIGKGVLLNNSVTISHNTVIGNCCYLSPGVVLSGNVTIGEKAFIGAGAIVANDINIGKNVIIGIGTVVTQDVADNCCVIGNPMKFVNSLHLV